MRSPEHVPGLTASQPTEAQRLGGLIPTEHSHGARPWHLLPFLGFTGPELSEDRCTRTLPAGAALSCSDSGKLGCSPKALPHPLWGCLADRAAERGGQEDGYRAERGEHRPQPFTAWSLGYRTMGPGAAPLSAPGSPRPPSNCGLAPGELSTRTVWRTCGTGGLPMVTGRKAGQGLRGLCQLCCCILRPRALRGWVPSSNWGGLCGFIS